MTASMLIIDDDVSVLASCRRIFTAEGFTVQTTTDPEEGLKLARQEQPTAILCDWQMPKLNGMDVVTDLEKHAPKSAMVMISGYPSISRATEALKRGAMD
jgi:formate transporter